MGDWHVRCDACVKDDCCKLWHDVFKGKLVVTAGPGDKECKRPCQCFVIIQDTDKSDNPTKVFHERLYPAEPGGKSLTIKDYDDQFNGGKYRLVAACLRMKNGVPVTRPIDQEGKSISAASRSNQAETFIVVKSQHVIRDRGSDRYLVVLKKPK